jgi:Fic family protein
VEDVRDGIIKNIIASYRIEGVILNYDELSHRFNSDTPFGVVSAYLDAYNTDTLLTIRRLLDWHSDILAECPENTHPLGLFRDDEVEISDGVKCVYVGIPHERIRQEIELLIDWVNNDNEQNRLVKAIIAHFWFETIHPFSDGNGRVGRLLIDFILKKPNHISQYILNHVSGYYNQLMYNQRVSIHDEIDITTFIDWFIRIVRIGITRDENERRVYALRSSNKRIESCLIYLLENGLTTISINRYRKLYSTTSETARKEISIINEFFKNE